MKATVLYHAFYRAPLVFGLYFKLLKILLSLCYSEIDFYHLFILLKISLLSRFYDDSGLIVQLNS